MTGPVLPVFDGHNDALTRADDALTGDGRQSGHLDLPRMRAGSVRGGSARWGRVEPPNASGHGVPFVSPSSPDIGPGLRARGRALARRCAELGILVDVSHLNEAGFFVLGRYRLSRMSVCLVPRTISPARLQEAATSDAPALSELVPEPEEWIRGREQHLAEHGHTYWATGSRSDRQLRGFCGFLTRDGRGTTLRYGVLSSARGLNLATRGCKDGVRLGSRSNLDFYASIRPPNPASVRVLEKIGFVLVDRELDGAGVREIHRLPLLG